MTDEPTLGEIARTLARLEASVNRVTDDHETRLRRVEKWMYAIPPTLLLGASSLVAALLG